MMQVSHVRMTLTCNDNRIKTTTDIKSYAENVS